MVYMRGAIGVSATKRTLPRIRRNKIIGISQNFFLSRKYPKSILKKLIVPYLTKNYSYLNSGHQEKRA